MLAEKGARYGAVPLRELALRQTDNAPAKFKSGMKHGQPNMCGRICVQWAPSIEWPSLV